MNKNAHLKSSACALGAAVIWGFAFVAQTQNTMGTFSINALRALVAFLFLLPVIRLFAGDRYLLKEKDAAATKKLWIGGTLSGISLAAASFLQQFGIDSGLTAGKAGFLTALYIVLVPVISLFIGRKNSWIIWLAVLLAAVSVYLLSIREGFTIDTRDIYVILAALLFAVQILVIDHYSPGVNAIRITAIQFLVMFAACCIPAMLTESITLDAIDSNLLPILYLGIASSGIAFTLQTMAQKDANPAVVSVLLSMESVFSVIGGAIIVRERLSLREYAGCAVMLFAVLLTQLPAKQKKNS